MLRIIQILIFALASNGVFSAQTHHVNFSFNNIILDTYNDKVLAVRNITNGDAIGIEGNTQYRIGNVFWFAGGISLFVKSSTLDCPNSATKQVLINFVPGVKPVAWSLKSAMNRCMERLSFWVYDKNTYVVYEETFSIQDRLAWIYKNGHMYQVTGYSDNLLCCGTAYIEYLKERDVRELKSVAIELTSANAFVASTEDTSVPVPTQPVPTQPAPQASTQAESTQPEMPTTVQQPRKKPFEGVQPGIAPDELPAFKSSRLTLGMAAAMAHFVFLSERDLKIYQAASDWIESTIAVKAERYRNDGRQMSVERVYYVSQEDTKAKLNETVAFLDDKKSALGAYGLTEISLKPLLPNGEPSDFYAELYRGAKNEEHYLVIRGPADNIEWVSQYVLQKNMNFMTDYEEGNTYAMKLVSNLLKSGIKNLTVIGTSVSGAAVQQAVSNFPVKGIAFNPMPVNSSTIRKAKSNRVGTDRLRIYAAVDTYESASGRMVYNPDVLTSSFSYTDNQYESTSPWLSSSDKTRGYKKDASAKLNAYSYVVTPQCIISLAGNKNPYPNTLEKETYFDSYFAKGVVGHFFKGELADVIDKSIMPGVEVKTKLLLRDRSWRENPPPNEIRSEVQEYINANFLENSIKLQQAYEAMLNVGKVAIGALFGKYGGLKGTAQSIGTFAFDTANYRTNVRPHLMSRLYRGMHSEYAPYSLIIPDDWNPNVESFCMH